ncbi:nucleotide exchange factor GrpE [Gymnodinialimonas hymeniacidonis]|uniref:nucleotide exchange factor GrpE n=1 Tax=Gymnodinialimonas hymeniacidonis TaxID=3126508 RepID=UPI0034C65CBB
MGEPKDEFYEDEHTEPKVSLAEDGLGDAPEVDLGEGVDLGAEAVIAALEAERDEIRDRMLRALAEAENMRKRADRDRREAEHYGGSKLSRDLLPVFDNLHRALDAADEASKETAGPLLEGVELTLKELLNVFGKHGITPIQPEVGDKFDPQLHQAMFEAPVPNTKAGDIIQVAATGFMLHDRLLRPAQVGVSSTPAG